MFTFILAIIGLFFIIGLISMLADFQNSAIECIIGIVGILVLYGLITGVMDFFFWLDNQIGPGYTIVVIILLIICPIIIWYLYDKLKSKGTIDSLSYKIKENKKMAAIYIIIVLLILILIIVVPIITYNPLDSEPFTVECPEGYSINDYSCGTIYHEVANGVGMNGNDITIVHHDAHGKKLKYWADKCKSNLYKPTVKKTSIDGVTAYDMTEYDWGFGTPTKWIIFVKNNECFLMKLSGDESDNEVVKNSFKFK